MALKRYDFPYLVCWALSSKNKLFVGSAVDYEFSVINLQGNLEFTFKKDCERIPGHVYSKLVFKNGCIYALKKGESGYPKALRIKLEE